MSDDNTYSIKEMIAEVRDDMNKRFDKVDDAQAHTNGDVTNLKIWRAYTTGGLAVISAIVIPLLIYVWNQNINTQDKLQTLISNKQ